MGCAASGGAPSTLVHVMLTSKEEDDADATHMIRSSHVCDGHAHSHLMDVVLGCEFEANAHLPTGCGMHRGVGLEPFGDNLAFAPQPPPGRHTPSTWPGIGHLCTTSHGAELFREAHKELAKAIRESGSRVDVRCFELHTVISPRMHACQMLASPTTVALCQMLCTTMMRVCASEIYVHRRCAACVFPRTLCRAVHPLTRCALLARL
jgi:hypothetical protein